MLLKTLLVILLTQLYIVTHEKEIEEKRQMMMGDGEKGHFRGEDGWMDGGRVYPHQLCLLWRTYCCCWQLHTHSLFPLFFLSLSVLQIQPAMWRSLQPAFPQRPLSKSRVYLKWAFKGQYQPKTQQFSSQSHSSDIKVFANRISKKITLRKIEFGNSGGLKGSFRQRRAGFIKH